MTDIFAAIALCSFYLIAFKLIRQSLDSDNYFLLCFLGAMNSIICAALCFVYVLDAILRRFS